MPQPPGQSDFAYVAPPVDPEAGEQGAGKLATRSVYTLMIIAFIVLFALVAIGLHIPAE